MPPVKEKVFLCPQEGCDKAFVRSEHLSRHRLNHRPKKVFPCTQCPKEFVRQDLLQRHQRRHVKGMWYRKVGGVVHPVSSTDEAEDKSTTDPVTQAQHYLELPETEPPCNQSYHSPGDDMSNLYRTPAEGANALFFDDSIGLQDIPDDLNWFFEDIPMGSTSNGELTLMVPENTLPFTVSSPFVDPQHSQQSPSTSVSMNSDAWSTVRITLLASLSSLPQEILDTSFFHPSNLAIFYELYFENYHPHFPFLHRPSLSPAEASPLLIAAIVTLGSTLASDAAHYNVGQRIHDSLRWITFGTGKFELPTPLWCLQTLLIIQAHAKMSSTRKHHEMAHIFHGAIITMMRRGSAYSAVSTVDNDQNTSLDLSWRRWVEEESSKRIAFFAFLMDAQHSSLFGHTPSLSANDIKLQLPCSEPLWDCPTKERWKETIRHTPDPPQFLPTLKALLNKTPVPPICSAYSRFVLLHGLMSVTTHLIARDLTTLGVGAGKIPPRDSSSPSSQIEDWKEIMSRAVDTWSFSLMSRSSSICLEAGRPLHRMAYITIDTNIHDFHIIAGAPSLLGSLLSRTDYAKANRRVRSWTDKPASKKTLYHSLLLVQETVFTSKCYRAKDDNLALRAWCLYQVTLILWAYGYMTEGKPEASTATLGAEEYLVHMLSSLATDKGRITRANCTRGLIQTIQESLEGCRWELLKEAHETLGRLLG